jgi:hypothetical protein
MLAERREWIYHMVGAEGNEIRSRIAAHGTNQYGHCGIQQAHGDRDAEIGMIVIGQRQHAPTQGKRESGCDEVLSNAGVAHHGRRVLGQVE